MENEEQLEDALSTPTPALCEMMRRLRGDIMVVGAGGKMGPSLVRLAKRASDEAGVSRRVIAASIFDSDQVRADLVRAGVEAISCDLLDPGQIAAIPRCENVIYMAGRKFGSTGRPDLTWAINVLLPSAVLRHFRDSRIVAFSSGNIYPFVPVSSGGSRETDEVAPVGEYAQTCLGRERVFEYYSREFGTRVLLFRLNYAVDLRYGVLVDIARKVYGGEPVELQVGHFNSLWQGDANSYALRCLEICETPTRILNVTGPETISVRKAALFFAERFGRDVLFDGEESETALLSNASACHALFGPPLVSIDRLQEWVAHWVRIGGTSLNKPTHFEVKNGKY
ncbi:MAG: NAD(P)-dependent oxidoreductase [Acidobacteria bacterium]|nr:NAD(P)-dependent oxidoreductase [Acidobacteriota bacterium]